MMWRGSSHTVVIQGAMPDVKTPALHLYGGQLGGNNSPAIHAATAAFEALFRARRVELEAATKATGSEAEIPQPSAISHQPSDIAEPKKKSNRKKAKKNEMESTKQMETASPAEESAEATA